LSFSFDSLSSQAAPVITQFGACWHYCRLELHRILDICIQAVAHGQDIANIETEKEMSSDNVYWCQLPD